MDKNYNPVNTRKGFEETTNINIEKEVAELFKKGGDRASMNDLRRKFGDDKIFDNIQEAYFEKLSYIRKRSIKFTKLIERKYGMYGHPLHIILNKAIKYKKKYNLSEEEFELFRQYYQKSMNSRNSVGKLDILLPNTNMAKIFGDDPYTNRKIHVNEGDHRIVKEIIQLYDVNRMLWQQVTLQSITYNSMTLIKEKFDEPYDSAVAAVAGSGRQVVLNEDRTNNYSSFIHPVVAAMFLPKIANFDEYFLFTNLAYILRCKYNGEPISTFHSYLMLYNLVTDPNDVVCNADSPIKDILNRVILQMTLWKNVNRLRQGGVYDSYNSFVAADFMMQIDNCKLSTYDAPDLMMIGDENIIIRRILSSLAYRCATMYSVPTMAPMMNNNIQLNTFNMPFNYTQVSKVAMIYIRLPPTGVQIAQNTSSGRKSIEDNLIKHFVDDIHFTELTTIFTASNGGTGPPLTDDQFATFSSIDNYRNSGVFPNTPRNHKDKIIKLANMIDVQQSLNTIQPIMSNGRFEFRSSTVATTEGVLIVSIPRRTYQPMIASVHNLPQVFNMSKLPHNAIGLESLNSVEVATNLVLSISNPSEKPDDAYNNNYSNKLFLKSAVVLNEKESDLEINKKFIYGSKTYVFNYDTDETTTIRVYDPIKETNNKNQYPIRKVIEKDNINDFVTNQTILIYTNDLRNIPQNTLSNITVAYRDAYEADSPIDQGPITTIKANYAKIIKGYLFNQTFINIINTQDMVANISQYDLFDKCLQHYNFNLTE